MCASLGRVCVCARVCGDTCVLGGGTLYQVPSMRRYKLSGYPLRPRATNLISRKTCRRRYLKSVFLYTLFVSRAAAVVGSGAFPRWRMTRTVDRLSNFSSMHPRCICERGCIYGKINSFRKILYWWIEDIYIYIIEACYKNIFSNKCRCNNNIVETPFRTNR